MLEAQFGGQTVMAIIGFVCSPSLALAGKDLLAEQQKGLVHIARRCLPWQ
jgi:hypothetical protein